MSVIKNGDISAESLASQSYLYRLGYVWLNVLMLEDKHSTSVNPLKWSLLDVVWIAYFLAMSLLLVTATALLGWFKAYAMKDVTPIEFDCGGPNGAETSTSYALQKVWYYDNGKIEII